jgi:hypothetical protein
MTFNAKYMEMVHVAWGWKRDSEYITLSYHCNIVIEEGLFMPQ